MKLFIYKGQQAFNATIRVKQTDGILVEKDIHLSNGDTIMIDEENDAIKSLVRSGYLEETTSPVTDKKSK